MNATTGQLVYPAIYADVPPDQKSNYVEVKRDLTVAERANMQIALYAPCVCGSGKKFKFCCKK